MNTMLKSPSPERAGNLKLNLIQVRKVKWDICRDKTLRQRKEQKELLKPFYKRKIGFSSVKLHDTKLDTLKKSLGSWGFSESTGCSCSGRRFPEPTGQLLNIWNISSRGSDTLSLQPPQVPTHMLYRYIYIHIKIAEIYFLSIVWLNTNKKMEKKLWKQSQTTNLRQSLSQAHTVALCTTAKLWSHPGVPPSGHKENLGYIQQGVFFSHKEWKSVICRMRLKIITLCKFTHSERQNMIYFLSFVFPRFYIDP